MQASISKRLAEFVVAVDVPKLPREVVHAARRAIFDTLGVMTAGSVHPTVRAVRNGFADGGGHCSVAGSREPASPVAAALINGTAAHVYDFDDTSYVGIGHGSAVVLPAALAGAEAYGVSEEELIAGFIAGCEVAYTLGAMASEHHFLKGWWSTTTLGLPGAVAALARIRRFDVTHTAAAIGLAGAAAGGGRSVLGSAAKPFLVGETASRAVRLADAVACDVDVPVDTFEHGCGYFALLNDGRFDASPLHELGRVYRVNNPGLFFKSSPVCSSAHPIIDAVRDLMQRASTGIESVAAIRVGVSEIVAMSLVHDRPTTPEQAQFSLPYAVACAALHRRVVLNDLTDAAIADPTRQAIMRKVSWHIDASLSSEEMRQRHPECVHMALQLVDGREFDMFCGTAHGMPADPLSDDELQAKFVECVSHSGISTSLPDVASVDLLTLARQSLVLSAG